MGLSKLDAAPRISHEVLLSLLNKPVYREKWMRHVQRRRRDSINQRAVASFIAYELSDRAHQDIDPATIKDRVSRALNGDSISDATAQMFITAFGFNSQEAGELQRAISSHRISRKIAQPVEVPEDPNRLIDTHDYISLSTLVEGHVDAFGYTRYFTVTEVIRSEIDELQEVTPRIETSPSNIHLLEGGELIRTKHHPTGLPHDDRNTIWQLKIKPLAPILKGQIHQISYRVDLEVDPVLKDLDLQNSVILGPFTPARFNLTLAMSFDAPPTGVHRKIWSYSMADENLVEDIEMPSLPYYSMSYPIAEDTVFAYFWDTHYREAVLHYHGDDPVWLATLEEAGTEESGK